MDSNPVIFDISSDEEPAFDELKIGDDDREWLTELLWAVDGEQADSDDVVVVDEYVPRKPKSKSKSSNIVKDIDDNDDDCMILDGNPDELVDVVDGPADDGDDVLVVGQKGPIACRDYPHPRHLCAKFPFGSTPHEKHCDLCHCYVCDSVAPCPHWGTGFSTIDHCHATDKQEMWKSQRQESFRLKKIASLPVSKFPPAHFPIVTPQFNQVASLDIPSIPKETENPVYRPTTIRGCSSARLNIPNIISQSRKRRPMCVQNRNGFLPRSVPQQAIRMNSNAILRNTGQQFVSCNAMFKRPRISQGASANPLVYASSNPNCPPTSHYARNTVPLAAVNARNSAGRRDFLPSMIPELHVPPSPSQPNTGSVNVNAAVTQPEVYSRPITQSNNDSNNLQFGNQSQNVPDLGLPDFDFGWVDSLGQSNQPTLSEDHLHATVSNYAPATEDEYTSLLAGSTKLHGKNNGYESWLLDESNVVTSEGCGPADLNIFYPEPAAFDADGMWRDGLKSQAQ